MHVFFIHFITDVFFLSHHSISATDEINRGRYRDGRP